MDRWIQKKKRRGEHQKVKNDPYPQLKDSGGGVVLLLNTFKITCSSPDLVGCTKINPSILHCFPYIYVTSHISTEYRCLDEYIQTV